MSSNEVLAKLMEDRHRQIADLKAQQDLVQAAQRQAETLSRQMEAAREAGIRAEALREELRKQEAIAKEAMQKHEIAKEQLAKTEAMLKEELQKTDNARHQEVLKADLQKQDRQLADLRNQAREIQQQRERLEQQRDREAGRDAAEKALNEKFEAARKEQEAKTGLSYRPEKLELTLKPDWDTRVRTAEEQRRISQEKQFAEIAAEQRKAFERRHEQLGTPNVEREQSRANMEQKIAEQLLQRQREERERADRMEQMLREQRSR